ncbi:MAG: EAL domain-containing protein [Sulfurimonas sp.]|nr:EAL domain-containing protein [Sulfurimonas sp.]
MQSIKSKLIVSVILIHAILMSLVIFDLVQRESAFMQTQLSSKAYELTSILAQTSSVSLLNNDLVALEELLSSFNNKSNNSMVFILDKSAKVRASTNREYFNKYLDDAISKNLLETIKNENVLHHQTTHDNVIDTIQIIEVEKNVIGYVRTILDSTVLSNELAIITQQGLFYVLLAILLGSFFAWFSVRKITSRLDIVALASEKIANKDFNVDLPLSDNNDEVSKMTNAFYVMSKSIQGYIDDLQKSNELIYNEKQLAEVTLSSIGDCVIVTDASGKITFINPAAEEIIKYNINEAKGKKIEELFELYSEDTHLKLESQLYVSIREERVVWLSNHTLLVNRYGRQYAIEDSSAPIKNIHGTIEGAILVFHDVTLKKKEERRIKWQSTHDSLTKLNNRLGFETVLNNLSQQPQRDNSQHALLFMDLDKFKIINDTAGHLAGDEILKQVASLLSKSIRKNDFLSRFGGDEFGLILFNCDKELSKEIAQKLIDAVLEYTFKWRDKEFKIGVSIGISMIDKDNYDPTLILSSADLACYVAKERGRNRYYIAQESDLAYLNNEQQFNWVSKINNALRDKKFVLHVQKIKDLIAENDHYEVLIRLLDEQNSIIYPDSFLPHAQKYALLPKIDRYVIEEFFSWFKTHETTLAKNLTFSVNITGQSISDVEFVDDVLLLVHKYNMDCNRVIFEITESTAIANLNESQLFFDKLTTQGFRFSLDDFGTGLSSFAYLKSLPIHFLKIDGAFIKNMLTDKIDRGMVESIFKIGSLMNLKIIAEYSETDAIISELKNIGIQYAQGYAVEKPHSIHDLLN